MDQDFEMPPGASWEAPKKRPAPWMIIVIIAVALFCCCLLVAILVLLVFIPIGGEFSLNLNTHQFDFNTLRALGPLVL
jgi:hypothetical protein